MKLHDGILFLALSLAIATALVEHHRASVWRWAAGQAQATADMEFIAHHHTMSKLIQATQACYEAMESRPLFKEWNASKTNKAGGLVLPVR